MIRPFRLVDVFGVRPFTGNPLGAVLAVERARHHHRFRDERLAVREASRFAPVRLS